MGRVDPEGPEVLEAIQAALRRNPEAGRVIPGTDGLRKARIGGRGKGKRGGYRVIYLDLRTCGVIYLLDIYAKNEKDDLSSEEKAILKRTAELIKREALRHEED